MKTCTQLCAKQDRNQQQLFGRRRYTSGSTPAALGSLLGVERRGSDLNRDTLSGQAVWFGIFQVHNPFRKVLVPYRIRRPRRMLRKQALIYKGCFLTIY